MKSSTGNVSVAWFLWLLLTLLIIAASAGDWAPDGPGIWAPLLVTPQDAARNLLVYVSFGVIGMIALGRTDLRGVGRVTASAALLSAAVETLQLYTIDRVASVIDVVWAVLGTVAGALAVLWLAPRLPPGDGRPR